MSDARDHAIGPTTVADWLVEQDSLSDDGSRLELIYGRVHLTWEPAEQDLRAAVSLARTLQDALRDGRCAGHYVVSAAAIEISVELRTALVPDVAVVDTKPVGSMFKPSNVVLVGEVWSPSDIAPVRQIKMAAYASAGVPFFWVAETPTVTAYRLDRGRYVAELTAEAGEKVTITAAPVPVTLDPAELFPG